MEQIFFSNGWKQPYCYTSIDMHRVINGPINDKNGIMDGGYYIYKNLIKRDEHINFLLKSKFKYIMGFDFCSLEEKEKLYEIFFKNKKNIYPIMKNIKDWEHFKNLGYKIEGISIGDIDKKQTEKLINLAHKNNYKIHYLGRKKNNINTDKITYLDINAYELDKKDILNLGNQNIVNLTPEVLSMGEFILYGSSLFINTPNDIDILYYGKYSEKQVKDKIKNKKVNVFKFEEEILKDGRITHLLFAIDNGVKLNKCKNLEKLYNNIKLNKKILAIKSFLSDRYYKQLYFDKELKTVLIIYYYYYNDSLSNFLYNKLHLIYKIIGDGDEKAEMLFNRMLFTKFGRKFMFPTNLNRSILYNRYDILKIIDLFFVKVENLIDKEKILISYN